MIMRTESQPPDQDQGVTGLTSPPGKTAQAPYLKLVKPPDLKPRPVRGGEALLGATDPRWVLAVRTAELLKDTGLPEGARERLVRLGCVMGLTPFDANLVIAIILDQTRRGYAPSECPTAGEDQLRLVPLTRRGKAVTWRGGPGGPAWRAAMIAIGLLMIEAGFLLLWLR